MLDYTLTYAGIPFVADNAVAVRRNSKAPDFVPPESFQPRKYQVLSELVEELNRRMPFQYLQDFSLPSNYPGRNLSALANEAQIDPQPGPEVRIGDWYYPYGAGRWSVFRMLATTSMAKAMSVATTGGALPKPFVMMCNPVAPQHSDSDKTSYTVTTNMYFLPSRPLAENGGGFEGFELVTLVDERYYFQGTPCSLRVTSTTQWSDLISQLTVALGIVITPTAISSSYSQPDPDSQFWCTQENASLLLDAVGYNIGMKLVRNMDGTYSFQSPTASQTVVNTNRGAALKVVRIAGGDVFNSGVQGKIPDFSLNRNSVVPQQVVVTFPKYVQGNDPVPHWINPRYVNPRPSCHYEESYGDVYSVAVPIASGGIQVSGLTGVSQTFKHTTAKALYSGEVQAASGGTPINSSGLTSLALQLAQDYYDSQVSSALDEVYPGTFNWTPEGIHDVIWTWSAKSRIASTRVMKDEWNTDATEYQHASPALSGYSNTPIGVGGPSVAQSWRDSFSGNISTTLSADMGSGDASASLTSVANFPTDSRWRGSVDGEVVLFEGTSGTSTPGVVYRGVDGTLPTLHLAGSAVTQVVPNTTYGVNLVTLGKNQFTSPGAWTSGGIQEVKVTPQIQTVRALTASGSAVGSELYFSGQLELFNPVTGLLEPQENVWLVDRNLTNSGGVISGKRYGGCFAGYGGPTTPQPLYQITNFPWGLAVTDLSGHKVSGVQELDFLDGFVVSGGLSGNAYVKSLPTITSGSVGSGAITSGAISSGNLGTFYWSPIFASGSVPVYFYSPAYFYNGLKVMGTMWWNQANFSTDAANPINPGNAVVMRFNTGAASTITGVTPTLNVFEPTADQVIVILNDKADTLSFSIVPDAGVPATTGFKTPGGVPIVLRQYEGALFVYDTTFSRWKWVGSCCGGLNAQDLNGNRVSGFQELDFQSGFAISGGTSGQLYISYSGGVRTVGQGSGIFCNPNPITYSGTVSIASGGINWFMLGSGAIVSGHLGSGEMIFSGSLASGAVAGGGGAVNILTSGNGLTTDAYVVIINQTNNNGVHGEIALKNISGVNSLSYIFSVTDFFGVIASGAATVIAAGGQAAVWFAGTTVGTALNPYKNTTLAVKSQVLGNPTGYAFRDSFVG